MAENKLDNAQLEAAVEEFVQDRQKEKYAAVMEILEKSVILVPALQPQGLDGKAEKLLKEGKPVQLPREARVMPCLLRKETGEQALPIFTSVSQIPQDKRSPALLAIPFFSCLSMVMEGTGEIEAMVLNPFTHNMVLTRAVLDVAVRRRDRLKQPKAIKVTERQFQDIVHNKVVLQLLPAYLFGHKEEGLKQLQQEEGAFLVRFYEGLYPKERKAAVAVSADEFSVMTLNLTEDMQLTRVDMPDGMLRKGMCYRVYAVWMRQTPEVCYYTLEKTEQGNYIGRVTADGKHEVVEAAPDNGAEIEAIMNLVSRSQEREKQ